MWLLMGEWLFMLWGELEFFCVSVSLGVFVGWGLEFVIWSGVGLLGVVCGLGIGFGWCFG